MKNLFKKLTNKPDIWAEYSIPENDDVAQKVAWRPNQHGGSNFKTLYLKQSGDVIKSKFTLAYLGFLAAFFIPAILAIVLGIPHNLKLGQISGVVFMILFASIYGGGILIMYWNDKKYLFDKSQGIYLEGKQFIPNIIKNYDEKDQLSNIYAIQLISEFVQSNESKRNTRPYYSHELNLVFKDHSRSTVIDHGDKDKITQSAVLLASFLSVPIWVRSK